MPLHRPIDRTLFSIDTGTSRIHLARIFLPLYLETLCSCTLGTVNTAIISSVSENAVGAIGASNQLIDLYNTVFSVVVMGATAVVSNSLGAARQKEARAASAVSLVFTAVLALTLGAALCLLRAPVLAWMHIDAGLLRLAGVYYGFRTALLVLPAMTLVMNALMRCHGVSYPAVCAGVLTNAVNLLGSFLSVRLLRAELSAVILGVSLSCVAGQLCGFLCALCLFRRHRVPLARPEGRRVWLRQMGAMLKIGIPGGMSTMGYTISQTVSTSLIGSLGPVYLSAKVYFSNVCFYCCMFSSSMGNANSVMVGYLCGRRSYDRAAALCRQLTRITCLVNLALSCLLWALRRPVLSLFTDQEEIFALSAAVLAIDIAVEQARARSQIYEYSLRATGDTFFSMVGILLSCWVNGVGVAYLLGIRLGLGLPGVWIGFALDETCRALVTWGRWRSKKWIEKNKKVLAQSTGSEDAV